MNHETSPVTARDTVRRALAAILAAAGAAVLAGCGQQTPGDRQSADAAAANASWSANSGCLHARPTAERAMDDLTGLRHGTTGAALRRLASAQAGLGALARRTTDDILQERLAEAFDSLAAFRSVAADLHSPAYADTYADLAGKLIALRRTCPVNNPGFETDAHGWSASGANTVLSRSSAAYDGHWSLKVTNTGTNEAAAGFTDSPGWVPGTLPGTERISLWLRAVSGTPTVTVRVRELTGETVVGSRQVTAKLGADFSFENLTYRVRHPGASRLSVTVTAADLPPGAAFLADDVTLVRG